MVVFLEKRANKIVFSKIDALTCWVHMLGWNADVLRLLILEEDNTVLSTTSHTQYISFYIAFFFEIEFSVVPLITEICADFSKRRLAVFRVF